MVFLSNAPRRSEIAAFHLKERGIDKSLYSLLYTSGEDCYKRLFHRDTPFYAKLGKRLYHLGPAKNSSLFDETDYILVTSLNKADFILNTGPLTWECKVDDYKKILNEGKSLNLPMVCPNPDKIVLHGEAISLCAGALADYYESIRGVVTCHGKPYADIYNNLFSLLSMNNPPKILIIGDSLETDIKGANNMKLDSLLVLSGIHNKSSHEIKEICKSYRTNPTFLADKMDW